MLENFGIGIDIVDINRFKEIPYKEKITFYEKIFDKKEIEYCLQFKDPYPHFAGKFALKESVIKSIHDKISFLDIQTSNSKYGPTINLLGKKAKKYSFLCSVSHEKEFAIAVVISSRIEKTR